MAKEKEIFYAEHTNSESEKSGIPFKRRKIIPKRFQNQIQEPTAVSLKITQENRPTKQLQNKNFNKRFEIIKKTTPDFSSIDKTPGNIFEKRTASVPQ